MNGKVIAQAEYATVVVGFNKTSREIIHGEGTVESME